MTTQSRVIEEPTLGVRTRSRPTRSVLALTAAGLLGLLVLAGTASLTASGNLALPFTPMVTLEGGMGSKADFFADPEVGRILMKHHISLVVTPSGSREVAVSDLDRYDFAVTSGQPAGDLIISRRARANRPSKVTRPFVSPLVFATYRPFARALERAGIVTAQPGGGEQPLYYTLRVDRLLAAVDRHARWSDPDFKISDFGERNGNEILAETSDPCTSNRGESYIGLLAYVRNQNQVPDASQADRLGASIKPILEREGAPPADAFSIFVAPEGVEAAPLIVSYEHEYLSYQMDYRAEHGHADDERVLLYPTPAQMSVPQFIAFDPAADRLAELIRTDPDLRRRAMELGLRLLARGSQDRQAEEMSRFLTAKGLSSPSFSGDSTRSLLPTLPVLEKMLHDVAGCENAMNGS